MSSRPSRPEVVATLEQMHAAVALEALEAAGVPAEACPLHLFAQLDYFRPHRLPLVELRVAASDRQRARRVLALLTEEAMPAALVEAEDADWRGQDDTPGTAQAPSAPRLRRTRWVVAAALATMAIATPLMTRGRGVGERIRRALDRSAPGDTGHDRITGPRTAEPVEQELSRAGLR